MAAELASTLKHLHLCLLLPLLPSLVKLWGRECKEINVVKRCQGDQRSFRTTTSWLEDTKTEMAKKARIGIYKGSNSLKMLI